MAVLVYLARRPGKVVGADELIDAIWLGRPMGDNPVYRCIAQLRRALGDDPRAPTCIATVPKKGYRLIAPVEKIAPEGRPEPERVAQAEPTAAAALAPEPAGGYRRDSRLVLLVLLAGLAGLLWLGRDGEVRSSLGPVRPTLAVLPFENLTGDSDQESFADGLSEAILNRLSAYRELRVIARTSSFAFKRSGYEVPRISALLGVQYVLQGSLQQEGNRLRVSASLVDSRGFQVWNGTFDHATGRDFDLQDEIAAAVATRIAPRLSAPPPVSRQPDFVAYQHFVLGHEAMVRRPVGFWRLAREHLDRAIEIDPGYAEAYAERAMAGIFGGFAADDAQAHFTAAQRDIDQALALDPNVASAHAAQGLLLQVREPFAHAAAEAPLRRALALDPNHVNAWTWLANALRAQGRHAEADAALESAARIDPLAPIVGANLAGEEARRGDAGAAERRLRRLMQVPQPAVVVHLSLFDLYRASGRLAEALEVAKRGLLLRAGSSDATARSVDELIRIYAMLGARERVAQWRGRAESGSTIAAMDRLAILLAASEPADVDYRAVAEEFRAIRAARGLDPDRGSLDGRIHYGSLLALAGEYGRAREVLEPAVDAGVASQERDTDQEIGARHALAWAWQQTGESGRAYALLALIEAHLRGLEAEGRLHRSGDLFEYARNQALLGDAERALELLERAERAGWRGYYATLRDPRWDALRGQPRFEAVMTRVKADLDTQLAEVERREAQDDFVARLEAAIESRETGAGSLERVSLSPVP